MKKLLLSILIFITVSISFAQIPTNGLVSFYPFNGNAKDSIGINNGIVNGAILTMDRFGMTSSAYSFNGISDYITLPSNTFHFSNYTYSFWMNMTTLPAFGDHRVVMSIGGFGGDQGVSVNNNYSTGSTLFDGIGSYSSASVATNTDGPTLNPNQWYHIVSVRDSNFLKTYVNGKLSVVSSSSNGSLPTYGTTPSAKIGSRFNQTLPFNGKVDDVRIYNRAIDSIEVKTLFQENFCFNSIMDTIVVQDTTYITLYDTIRVNIYDTLTVNVYDTVLVSVTDTLIIDAVLSGVNPPNNINRLKVYPNPTFDRVFVDNGNYTLMSNFRLKIINTTGQEVFNSLIDKKIFDINLSTFTGRGTYFVMLYDNLNNLLEVKKIILK